MNQYPAELDLQITTVDPKGDILSIAGAFERLPTSKNEDYPNCLTAKTGMVELLEE